MDLTGTDPKVAVAVSDVRAVLSALSDLEHRLAIDADAWQVKYGAPSGLQMARLDRLAELKARLSATVAGEKR